MITAGDLTGLVIRRVVFHDVPNQPRGLTRSAVLSDVETQVNPAQKAHLSIRLTRVLASSNAYPIKFSMPASSPVPGVVRDLTANKRTSAAFVAASQQLANFLLELQLGSVSPGLLCVMEVVANGRAGVVLMKLEREEGARLELTGHAGKKTFQMSVLNNLVLTDGTRLFKSAMFVRTGQGHDDFRAAACDVQLNVMSSSDFARFWLRFLGCTFLDEPRVATQRFFDSTIRFINSTITDPIEKSNMYDHLQSQLTSHRQTFSPRSFINDYVPDEYQSEFRDHLTSETVPIVSFKKDLEDIAIHLRRKAYQTTKGGLISVPADVADIVEIRAKDILVKDSVLKVK